MPDTALRTGNSTGQLMASSLDGRSIALPCTRDICLDTLWTLATPYHEAGHCADYLQEGEPLRLQREPDTPRDSHVIALYTESGDKLGYVPERHNRILANLMDAGKYLKGVIERTTRSPTGRPCVRIRILMREF